MRRTILITLLTLGTVGGYASGIHALKHRGACRGGHAAAYNEAAKAPCGQARWQTVDRGDPARE